MHPSNQKSASRTSLSGDLSAVLTEKKIPPAWSGTVVPRTYPLETWMVSDVELLLGAEVLLDEWPLSRWSSGVFIAWW